MNYIRYAFVTALVCLLALSIYGLIAPGIVFTLPDGSELDHQKVDPIIHTNAISAYRIKVAPWLLLNGSLLCGWLFLRSRKVAYRVTAVSVIILGYIAFTSVRGLGYTAGQSVSAFFQGHGDSISGWTWFYLATLAALLFSTRKNPELAAPSNP